MSTYFTLGKYTASPSSGQTVPNMWHRGVILNNYTRVPPFCYLSVMRRSVNIYLPHETKSATELYPFIMKL